MANIAQSLAGDLEHIAVAIPGGVQGVRPTFPAINILWKWNNLVSMRPSYFIFI